VLVIKEINDMKTQKMQMTINAANPCGPLIPAVYVRPGKKVKSHGERAEIAGRQSCEPRRVDKSTNSRLFKTEPFTPEFMQPIGRPIRKPAPPKQARQGGVNSKTLFDHLPARPVRYLVAIAVGGQVVVMPSGSFRLRSAQAFRGPLRPPVKGN
jgi:hypothetical protein